MNLVLGSILVIFSTVLLFGCSKGIDTEKTSRPSDLQDVRIEFADFLKSKGGAT